MPKTFRERAKELEDAWDQLKKEYMEQSWLANSFKDSKVIDDIFDGVDDRLRGGFYEEVNRLLIATGWYGPHLTVALLTACYSGRHKLPAWKTYLANATKRFGKELTKGFEDGK